MLTCDTGVALIFYDLFKPVGKTLSLLAAIFRLILVVMLAVDSVNYFGALKLFRTANPVATFDKLDGFSLAPFGVHCLLIGYLIYQSRFLPRFMGVLMAFAGFSYLTYVSPPLAHYLYPYNLVPGVLGEGALTLWLLVMGVNAREWNEQARVTMSPALR